MALLPAVKSLKYELEKTDCETLLITSLHFPSTAAVISALLTLWVMLTLPAARTENAFVVVIAWFELERDLPWIVGKISLLKAGLEIGTGCPGKGQSPCPWRYSRSVQMWRFRI